jgi:sulfide dehydrogenase cytochrome subunit
MSRTTAGLIAALILLPATTWAVDLATLRADCEKCHGASGISEHPDVPTIAGQSARFLTKTLRGFSNWDRPCIKSSYLSGDSSRETDMCRIAGALGPDEITLLSEFYSQQKFVPAKQTFDEALAAEGAALHEEFCETCHKQGGSEAGRGPRLAGQWIPYMKATLKYVPTGEHLVPPLMENSVADFSPEDIDRLMNFYASQQD